MARLPAGYTKVTFRNKDGTNRVYVRTRFYKCDGTGKRKRIAIYGTSLEAAQAKRQKLEGRRIASFDADKRRFCDYLTEWLTRSSSEKAWSTRTIDLYKHLIDKHIQPYFSAAPLGRITKEVVLSYFAQLRVGSRTRQQVYLLLRASLANAVEDDVISVNPVGRPPKHSYRQFRSLTREEARRLLEVAQTSKHFTLLYLALVTGMRQGELFGLRWENIDFGNRFVSVTNTLIRRKSEVALHPPKGKRMRRIELSDQDIEVLRRHRESQKSKGFEDWVFTDTEGNPLQRHNFRHRDWHEIVEAAGLLPLRFHDLRHTAATLGLAAGAHIKAVQERLGHASAKMTLDVYAKAVPSIQREVADQMTGIVGDWVTFGVKSQGSVEKGPVK